MSSSLQELRDSSGTDPDTFPNVYRFFRDVSIFHTVKTTINSTLTGFILNNPTDGLIDSTIVTAYTADSEILSVKSQNNTFYDNFDTTDYIDLSATTGSATTADDETYYELGVDEILQTEIIQKDEVNYSKCLVSVEGTSISEADIYLSGDNGDNWELASNNSVHSFTNYDDSGYKLKIIGDGTQEINSIKLKFYN